MIENKEVPMMAMTQEEYESLMMAHDNLQRELVEIKRLMGKDKHELIKANIALNKRVQELEDKLARIHFVNNDYDKTNKRYREAIDKIKGELYKMSAWGKEEISMLDIIHDLEGEE